MPAATVLAADGGDVLTGTTAPAQPWVGGAATYQGWYEIFPNAPVFYAFSVGPGGGMDW